MSCLVSVACGGFGRSNRILALNQPHSHSFKLPMEGVPLSAPLPNASLGHRDSAEEGATKAERAVAVVIAITLYSPWFWCILKMSKLMTFLWLGIVFILGRAYIIRRRTAQTSMTRERPWPFWVILDDGQAHAIFPMQMFRYITTAVFFFLPLVHGFRIATWPWALALVPVTAVKTIAILSIAVVKKA